MGPLQRALVATEKAAIGRLKRIINTNIREIIRLERKQNAQALREKVRVQKKNLQEQITETKKLCEMRFESETPLRGFIRGIETLKQ
jgi:hypothetical protein